MNHHYPSLTTTFRSFLVKLFFLTTSQYWPSIWISGHTSCSLCKLSTLQCNPLQSVCVPCAPTGIWLAFLMIGHNQLVMVLVGRTNQFIEVIIDVTGDSCQQDAYPWYLFNQFLLSSMLPIASNHCRQIYQSICTRKDKMTMLAFMTEARNAVEQERWSRVTMRKSLTVTWFNHHGSQRLVVWLVGVSVAVGQWLVKGWSMVDS